MAALTVLTLLVAFCGLTPACADDKPVQRYTTTFSYTTFDVQLPLVQVRMNNKITGAFLLDTGSNFCMLSETMAGKLGLTPVPAAPNGKPFLMDGHQASFVNLTTVQIGSLTFGPVPFAVLKDKRFSFGAPVDGVIGANLLSLFSVFFDFPRHQITLWLPGGLSSTEPVSHSTQPSFQGSFAADRARLATLRIGDIEVADKLVDYPSEDSSQFPPVLGMDTLAGYRVLLDFPSKRMYIQYAVPTINIKPAEAKTTKP